MAGNKDFIDILREIRGTGIPGEAYSDGIWYELTIADKDSNPGIYGDILSKYGIIKESVDTFDQAVAILEKLNVEVTTLPAGTEATSALVNGVWQLGIPRGAAGIDAEVVFTPDVAINYSLGNLNYTVKIDGVQVTNDTLVNLDNLVNTVVNANIDVQTTLTAKQEVIEAVAIAQAISDGLDDNVTDKIVQLSEHTTVKLEELNSASAAEQLEIVTVADAKKLEYDQNVIVKVEQYNNNHTTKLDVYNANDTMKLNQYNANHVERLENLDEKYATRIVDMLNTNKILGMIDKFVAITPTQYATFIDTSNGTYIYYLNGSILHEITGYTVFNDTTIELVNLLSYGDVVTQVDSTYIGEYLQFNGVVLEERIDQPNGVAGLDENGKLSPVILTQDANNRLVTDLEKSTWNAKESIAVVTTIVNGLMIAEDKIKLDAITGSNTGDQTTITGNAGTATKLATPRTISLAGAVTGTVNFDGSAGVSMTTAVGDNTHSHGDSTITDVAWSKISGKPDPVITVTLTGDVTGTANTTLTDLGNGTVSLATTIAANSIALGTDTTGNYVADMTAGTYITKSGTAGEGWSPTINVDATSTNTASKVVARDASGNFSAGTITATLSGNATTSSSTTGNAATATKLVTAMTINGVSFDGTANIVINAVDSTSRIASSEKGVANGIATLDSNGKVVLSQINDSILGQLEYQSVWNFTTMPTATEKGQYWIASVAGSGYEVGDWAVYNGVTFDKVDNTDAVASVAGRTGVVVLTKTDVGLGNIDNTSDLLKPISTATQTALNLKANLDSPTFTGTVNGVTKTMVGLGNVDNTSDATKNVLYSTTAGAVTGQGALATLSSVNASTITDNSVGAAELNVTGNGTTSQYLRSEGDGTFTWATPTDTNTTYTAGVGLSLTGTVFANTSPNVSTNLTYTTATTTGSVNSSDGTNATIPAATTSLAGLMTNADKSKLDGVATGANNYVHPTSDGSLHVPATSTTNNGKFLMAGATAGSLSWETPVTNSDTAVNLSGGYVDATTGSFSDDVTFSGDMKKNGNIIVPMYIQSTEPTAAVGETVLWLETANNGRFSFWIKKG